MDARCLAEIGNTDVAVDIHCCRLSATSCALAGSDKVEQSVTNIAIRVKHLIAVLPFHANGRAVGLSSGCTLWPEAVQSR